MNKLFDNAFITEPRAKLFQGIEINRFPVRGFSFKNYKLLDCLVIRPLIFRCMSKSVCFSGYWITKKMEYTTTSCKDYIRLETLADSMHCSSRMTWI